jgi:hypothetical protein
VSFGFFIQYLNYYAYNEIIFKNLAIFCISFALGLIFLWFTRHRIYTVVITGQAYVSNFSLRHAICGLNIIPLLIYGVIVFIVV